VREGEEREGMCLRERAKEIQRNTDRETRRERKGVRYGEKECV